MPPRCRSTVPFFKQSRPPTASHRSAQNPGVSVLQVDIWLWIKTRMPCLTYRKPAPSERFDPAKHLNAQVPTVHSGTDVAERVAGGFSTWSQSQWT